MPLDASDIQGLILSEVGDVDPNGDATTDLSVGVIAAQMDNLWERHAAWDQVRGGLRELHVRRDAIRIVLAVLATRVYDAADNIDGASMRANQIWQHYTDMLKDTEAEITAALKAAAAANASSNNLGRIKARLHSHQRRYPLELDQYGRLRDW